MKVSTGLASSEASLLADGRSTFSLCSHVVFLLRTRVPGASSLFKFLLVIRTLVILD